jgi:hypothetical protein
MTCCVTFANLNSICQKVGGLGSTTTFGIFWNPLEVVGWRITEIENYWIRPFA